MATRKTNKTAQKTVKKEAEKKEEALEVKASDVMSVNEDGSMEPLTETFPEISPEETVTVPAEAVAAQVPAPVPFQYQEPMVKLIYLDSCIENNQIPIGGGRVITGSGRRFSVKLSDFEGVFLTPLVSLLLKKRKFIVLDGLTAEQRQQYGVDYRPGEILKNEGMFDWFLSGPVSQVKAAFADLCPEHRELVARRFMMAFENKDNRLTRDRIEALNEVSKRDFEDCKGAFTPIPKAINEAAL